MVNYQNTKIYKIVSASGDRVYIDATAKEYLSQRMTAHRNDYNQWKKVSVISQHHTISLKNLESKTPHVRFVRALLEDAIIASIGSLDPKTILFNKDSTKTK